MRPVNRKDSTLSWEPQTWLGYILNNTGFIISEQRVTVYTSMLCLHSRTHLADAQSALAASLTTDLIIQINMLILTETSRVNLRWRAENNEHYSLTTIIDVRCCLLIGHECFFFSGSEIETAARFWYETCAMRFYFSSFIASASRGVEQTAEADFRSYSPWVKLHRWWRGCVFHLPFGSSGT